MTCRSSWAGETGCSRIHCAHGVGSGPAAVVTGDFNSDGITDRAVVNPIDYTVSVFMGRGDGTFQDPATYAVGSDPVGLLAGDFNRDGRLDLATVDLLSDDVSLLLGLGDGTFADAVSFPVGDGPESLIAGDFNGDGRLDLATANSRSQDVSLLLGGGDGTFEDAVPVNAGPLPAALVGGDFNGDGFPDLAAASLETGDVSVMLGRGDGSFRSPLRFAAGADPGSLVAGDFNGDGFLDLATANEGSNDVSVLPGRGDGTFGAPVHWAVGKGPRSLVTGDFNGDGRLDLASANAGSDDVSVLLGQGDGTFAGATGFPVGDFPVALVTGDFNGDGRLDLATADQQSGGSSTLIGLGDGTFDAPGTVASAVRSNPLVGDLNGDGVPDVVVVNQRGQILLRLGRPGEPGTFEPPVIVNPDPEPEARDLALVRTGAGLLLAALDARSSTVSLYAPQPDGTFRRTAGPEVPGTLAVRIAAGDLNGDGRDDLVVVAAGSRQVFIYLQNGAGAFASAPNYRLDVGIRPSDVQLVDVDGDGRPDIVVTNQFSGDVTVLRNSPDSPFGAAFRFRAATGLYGMDFPNGAPAVDSLDGTAGVIAGHFDEARATDLVVTNSGTDSFSLLPGTAEGGFLNPVTSPAWITGTGPTVVTAGDFNRDGHLDLAILNQVSGDISVFLGDGHGHFAPTNARPSAGNAPTGLTVADSNGDGFPDLLVRNEFGDVLVLLGNGDGTFQPYRRTEQNIALAVTDLNGDGRPDFIFANQGLDHVSVQYSQAGQSFSQDRADGLLAPGAVSVADLNGDGLPDLIVANSGSNDVLVYLGTGNGQFSPVQTFFAGTNPAGVTAGDLNGDGVPDLIVANEGSNDVSVLLGQGQGSSWTLTAGPRLQAGGVGPVATTVADVTGPRGVPDGIPDLVVTNSQSNRVALLPGVGGGFFDDRSPQTFATGIDPVQSFVGNFGGTSRLDLVTINAGSNDLTFFPGFGAGRSIASGGVTPVAGVVLLDAGGNGLSDLVVANNGDGAFAVFVGGAEGLSLASVFAQAGVPNPTALAVSGAGEGVQIYATEEGEESAILLTSFGIPVLSVAEPGLPAPLSDVLLVNGPGFATGLDIVSSGSETAPAAAVTGLGCPLDTQRNRGRSHRSGRPLNRRSERCRGRARRGGARRGPGSEPGCVGVGRPWPAGPGGAGQSAGESHHRGPGNRAGHSAGGRHHRDRGNPGDRARRGRGLASGPLRERGG